MKINLESMIHLYNAIDKDDFKEYVETFDDFKQYVINTIIDNLEYDLGISFSDYVDLNMFIESGENNE